MNQHPGLDTHTCRDTVSHVYQIVQHGNRQANYARAGSLNMVGGSISSGPRTLQIFR